MKKLFLKLDHVCGGRWFPLLFIPIALCFLLLYSYTTSPLFLNEGMDSAVFKTMGLAILKGKIPYVDIFDHKGPILYFINALGQWIIPGRMGIFLLQVIGLSVALAYMFKTAQLFVGNALSFLIIPFTLFIFGGIIQEGNQCEEWMMYFFTAALYYALKYFVHSPNQPHQLRYSLFYGFCFGMTFFIRPNDAVAMMGGMMIGVTVWLVYNREYKNAFLNAMWFVVGLFLVAFPVVIYFAYHHALGDFWYGLIGFNKGYSGGLAGLVVSVLDKRKISLALLFVAFVVVCYESGYKSILWVVVPCLLLELILLGTAYYSHYYIFFTPFFMVYFALLWRPRSLSVVVLVMAVFCCSLQTDYLRSFVGLAKKCLKERIVMMKNEKELIAPFYEESDKMLSLIHENERDEVWNYDLGWDPVTGKSGFSVLYHSGIVQCNMITCGADIKLKSMDDFEKKLPLWAVFNREKEVNIDDFLQQNYDLIWQTDTAICKLELYRRK